MEELEPPKPTPLLLIHSSHHPPVTLRNLLLISVLQLRRQLGPFHTTAINKAEWKLSTPCRRTLPHPPLGRPAPTTWAALTLRVKVCSDTEDPVMKEVSYLPGSQDPVQQWVLIMHVCSHQLPPFLTLMLHILQAKMAQGERDQGRGRERARR